jgi:hypothetical protein
MNQEAQRQAEAWKAVRARMGAPLTPVVPTLPRPPEPKPKPIKPIRLIREKISAKAIPIIVTGFWGYHALPVGAFRKTAAMIISEVSEASGYSIEDLKGPSRCAPLVAARQFAIWRVRKECPHLSLPQIGRFFGGRDHTTVLHAIRKIERLRAEANPEAIAA